MASVDEVSAPYANFMVNPTSQGTCPMCHGFARPGYTRCFGCSTNPAYIDRMVPITYSVHLGAMHNALRTYKEHDYPESTRRPLRFGLAAVLWRFLINHEDCLARATGVTSFEYVVHVPSNTAARDDREGGLRSIVSEIVGHTAPRYTRAIVATDKGSSERHFDPNRYRATQRLDGANVLLIDDTWASGSKAQSAAYTLKHDAGVSTVTCVVIGRHVQRDFGDTATVLDGLPPFDWDTCAVHV